MPKPEEVIKDATVKKALEEAWSDMLKRSTEVQRQEVGFWIYYDPVKKQYYIGKKRYGMAVKNDGNKQQEYEKLKEPEKKSERRTAPLSRNQIKQNANTIAHNEQQTNDKTKTQGQEL